MGPKMNLANLMAPDQGKTLPQKGPQQSQAETEGDTEFAAIVSNQSAEGEQSVPAPEQTEGVTQTVVPQSAGTGLAPPLTQQAIFGMPKAAAPEVVESTGKPIASATPQPPTTKSQSAGAIVAPVAPVDVETAKRSTTPAVQPATVPAETAPKTVAAPPGLAATSPTAPSDADVPEGAPVKTPESAIGVIRNRAAQASPAPTAQPSDTTAQDRTAQARSAEQLAGEAKRAAVPVPADASRQSVTNAPTIAPATPSPQPARDSARAPSRLPEQAANGTRLDLGQAEGAPAEEVETSKPAAVNEAEDALNFTRKRGSSALLAGRSAPLASDVSFGAPTTASTTVSTATPIAGDGRSAMPDPRTVAQHAAPQIVNAVAARVPGTAIDITLDPPELGRIEIVLDFAENGLRASLSIERNATSDLLKRHADILSEYFEDAGFADVDLSFSDTMGEQADNGPRDGAVQGVDEALSLDKPATDGPRSRSVQSMTDSGMDILL